MRTEVPAAEREVTTVVGRPRRLRWAVVLTLLAALVGAGLSMPGTASAAPAGPVDPGIPFSSIVYGTGCSYTLKVPVNSSGVVTFYEKRRGQQPRRIGAEEARQGTASVWWIPRRIGTSELYAVQNGERSRPTVARVRQGYGSGGLCFAL